MQLPAAYGQLSGHDVLLNWFVTLGSHATCMSPDLSTASPPRPSSTCPARSRAPRGRLSQTCKRCSVFSYLRRHAGFHPARKTIRSLLHGELSGVSADNLISPGPLASCTTRPAHHQGCDIIPALSACPMAVDWRRVARKCSNHTGRPDQFMQTAFSLPSLHAGLAALRDVPVFVLAGLPGAPRPRHPPPPEAW